MRKTSDKYIALLRACTSCLSLRRLPYVTRVVTFDVISVLFSLRLGVHRIKFQNFLIAGYNWFSKCSSRSLNNVCILCTCMYIAGYVSRYSDSLRARRSEDRIPVGARFPALVQTSPGAHPTFCTMGTGSFPGAKRPGRGVHHSSALQHRE